MADWDANDYVDSAVQRDGFKGLSNEQTYAGVLSFLRRTLTKSLEGVDVTVFGIPFDCATTNRPGTRLGPRAVREASTLIPFDAPYGWDVDPLNEFNVSDHGDFAFDHGDIQVFPKNLRDYVAQILDRDVATLAIGGDHYVTYPVLQAYAAKYGPISLIQFDAHTDTWVDEEPHRIDHGTMFYKAVKEGIVAPERSVQVGIRTSNSDTLGVTILDARKVHLEGPVKTAARCRDIVGDHPAYVTFDIDALDPAFAPGTGTPVSGGLTTAQTSIILRDLAGINVVGMDVVEVSPPYDTTGATAVAAAQVATDLLCLWAHRQKFGAKS